MAYPYDGANAKLHELAPSRAGDPPNFDAVSSATVGATVVEILPSDRPAQAAGGHRDLSRRPTEADVGAVVNMSQSPARRKRM